MNLMVFTISLAFYFALHSVLANNKVKAILQAGLIPKKYYRLLYNFTSLALIIPLFFLAKKVPFSAVLQDNYWVKIIAVLTIAIGAILMLLALRQYDLGDFAGTKQIKKSNYKQGLKITGFNRFVRHPLYLSILNITWGYFLLKPSALNLSIALVITVYIYIGTRLEEQKLIKDFGQDYVRYQKDVPMLIPFFKF